MSVFATVVEPPASDSEAELIRPPSARLLKLAVPALDLLSRYFRAEVLGLENVPERPALLVGNHNAGITFLEPMFLGRAWLRATGGRDPLYFLGHDVMVSMPLVAGPSWASARARWS